MPETQAVDTKNLRFSYKDREALKGVSFQVGRGEIFGLLGPNGSGKTTLFRILSTFFPVPAGFVSIAGEDLSEKKENIRKKIGVVFQSPSLDPKLTVLENLKHQGYLYGLHGTELKNRCREMLERLGVADRSNEMVQKLSGGLKRRVELAKGLLHQPSILILDEPSTGLDFGARLDLWRYLKNLRDQNQMAILVTTHLMEEAEHCDRIAILNEGQIVSLGKPDALKREIGNDIILVKTPNLENLKRKISEKFKEAGIIPLNGKTEIEDGIQIEHPRGAEFVARLAEAFPGEIEAITYRKPTLEDVFIHKTGHRFWKEEGMHE